MECLLQYWDELDDLYWSIAAVRERVIGALLLLLGAGSLVGVAAVIVRGAVNQPLLSLLTAGLLAATLVLRVRLRNKAAPVDTPSAA